MQEVLTTLARWFDWFNRGLAFIACALLVALTAAICVEIVSRSFLDISNLWLVELSEITLLYITFLAAAWVLGKDKHVSIDLILERIDPNRAKYLHLVLSLAAAFVCFVITWFGILTVVDQFVSDIREPTVMAPATFWITAVVPFGLFLLGCQFLRRGVRAITGRPLSVGED